MTDKAPNPNDPDSRPAVSPALRARLQQCFEHASRLMAAKEYDVDYANEMLTECVTRDPGNLVYVEAFLDNLQRKHVRVKKTSRFSGFGGRGGFKKTLANKDWQGVIEKGIPLLHANPWDVAALRGLAAACEGLHFNDVELRYLKNALDGAPRDADVNRHCGRSLARMGQFDQAIACWHRVEEIQKGDDEAKKMISQLTMERSRDQAGFSEPGTFDSLSAVREAREQAEAVKSEETARVEARRSEVQLTPRQKLERAIEEDPTQTDNYFQLVSLLCKENRFKDAEMVLRRGFQATGGDIHVRERLEDVQILRAKSHVAVAQRRAEQEGSDESRELLNRLRGELNRMEIDIFGSRVERYPNNFLVAYQLAVRLKRAANYDQAIEILKKVIVDQQFRGVGLVEQGECLQHQRKFAEALNSYRAATKAAEEHQDVLKLALYRLGVLAMGLNDLDVAYQTLDRLYQLDKDYKDAGSRLDKLQEIRDKGGASGSEDESPA